MAVKKHAYERASLFGGDVMKQGEEVYKVEKKSIFSYLESILQTKTVYTIEELREYDPFMINRFLSSIEMYIGYVAMANCSVLMSNKMMHYEFLKNALPYRKQSINKGNMVTIRTNKEMKQLVGDICKYERVGTNDINFAIQKFGFDMVRNYADRYVDKNKR